MQLTWAGGSNSNSCCNSNDECKNIRMMKNRESMLYSRCMCNNECKNIRMMNSNGCCNSNDEGVYVQELENGGEEMLQETCYTLGV